MLVFKQSAVMGVFLGHRSYEKASSVPFAPHIFLSAGLFKFRPVVLSSPSVRLLPLVHFVRHSGHSDNNDG